MTQTKDDNLTTGMDVTKGTNEEEARYQSNGRLDRISNSEEMKGVARKNSTSNGKRAAIETRLRSELAVETTTNRHQDDDNMDNNAPKRQRLDSVVADCARAAGNQSSSETTPSDLTTPMMENSSSSNSASTSDTDSASNNDDNVPARKRMKARFIHTNTDHDKTMSPMSTSGGTITQSSKAAAALPIAPGTKLTSDSIRRNAASNEGVPPSSSSSVPLHVGTNATGSNTSSELAADEEYDRDNDFRDIQGEEERRRHDIILDKTKQLLRESALYAFELVNGYKPPPHLLHGNMGYSSSSGGTTATSNRNQQNDGTCSSQDSSSGQEETKRTPMDEEIRHQVHAKETKPGLADDHDDGVEADHEFEEAPMSSSSEDGAGGSSAENSNNSGGNKRRGGASSSARLGHSASKASHGSKGGGLRIHWNVGRGRSTGGASTAPAGASALPQAPTVDNAVDAPISRLNRDEIEKKITQQRRKQWAKLLEERPPMEDKQRTSEWLLRVFLVSDLDSDGSMTAKAFAEQVEGMEAAEQEKSQAPAGMQVGENQPGRQFSHYHDQNQQPGGAPVATAISTVSSLSEDQHGPSSHQRRHDSKRSRVSDGMADDTSKEASNSDHTK